MARRRWRDEEGASTVARRWRRVDGGTTIWWREGDVSAVESSNCCVELETPLREVDGRKSSKERHRRSSNAGTSSKRRIEKKWTFKIIKRVSRQRYVAIGGTSSWECRRGNFVGGASSKECLHRKPEVVSQNWTRSGKRWIFGTVLHPRRGGVLIFASFPDSTLPSSLPLLLSLSLDATPSPRLLSAMDQSERSERFRTGRRSF